MVILDGKALAENKYIEIKKDVAAFVKTYKRAPKLSVVIVGDDPASHVYVNNKRKACEKVGMLSEIISLSHSVSIEELKSKIKQLNEDNQVDGFLVQMPLPDSFKNFDPSDLIDPEKDVDGLSALNMGKMITGKAAHEPCTPEGVMELLKFHDIQLEGKKAVVIGRSKTVGWPMAYMLNRANCTVTVCHSRTKNMEKWVNEADILVVAAGKPEFLSLAECKQGVVVVDIGIHRKGKKLVGDVNLNQMDKSKVAAMTPVPGGVGPMTVAQLIQHTLNSATQKVNKKQ